VHTRPFPWSAETLARHAAAPKIYWDGVTGRERREAEAAAAKEAEEAESVEPSDLSPATRRPVGANELLRPCVICPRCIRVHPPAAEQCDCGELLDAQPLVEPPTDPTGKQDCGATPREDPTPSVDQPDVIRVDANDNNSVSSEESSPVGSAVQPACIACGDTGQNSRGGPCLPCERHGRIASQPTPKPKPSKRDRHLADQPFLF